MGRKNANGLFIQKISPNGERTSGEKIFKKCKKGYEKDLTKVRGCGRIEVR